MPKLKDLFKLAKNKVFINLEIKDPRVDIVFPKVIKLIEKYNFFDQIALSSFHFGYNNKKAST
jgi:glycerophosphoryl diester phosphodiesterase